MNEQSPIATEPPVTVAALRAELGLTLAEMGERVGLSKSQMHDVEKSNRASLRVALAFEQVSDGRIDAADLNDDVRASRHGLGDTRDECCAATGKPDSISHDAGSAER